MTISPGADLSAISDDELRALIGEYGIDSPWYGEENEDTLRVVVHGRSSKVSGLYGEMERSAKTDVTAARERGDDKAIMTLTYETAATKDARAAYNDALRSWVAGSL